MKLHKEGKQIIINSFIIITILCVAATFLTESCTAKYIIAIAGLLFFFLICRFFRVPKREIHVEDGAVIAPADGTVVIIKNVYEGEFLKKEAIQVSVFMSVFNVHINWFPVGGKVEYYKYHPGKYLVAFHPKSSEKNERTTIVVNDGKNLVLFRQIAGLLARRIVCYAKEGKMVNQCDQAGFIKFGSRIDIFLPTDSEILVKRGDKVTGSRTVIAKLP